MQELLERYPILKQFALPIILGVLGVICLVYGLISFSKPQDKSKDILFEAASDTSPMAKEIEKERKITVDVEGAVVSPGVYTLKSDSRIQDALIAAGGMAEGADREQVAKGLNLAAKLTDGAKLFIPAVGEELAAGNTASVMGTQTASVININEVSQSVLEDLPGIGKTTAEKIIQSRPYATIEDLLKKKIVGQKVFDQIKDKIAVY